MKAIIKKLEKLQESLETKFEYMEDTFEDRSDTWQDSERGQDFSDKMMATEEALRDIEMVLESLQGAFEL
tara:strand:+ start:328 stop:537 length:210 start_codon:yes stop_codon:yes gene_type:complete